jgi:large subunit ribosomal protein L28
MAATVSADNAATIATASAVFDLRIPLNNDRRCAFWESAMANSCDICGKGRLVGNKVSHSNIKTKRVQRPNLQRVHAVVDGAPRRINTCTRCLRSGAVTKVA